MTLSAKFLHCYDNDDVDVGDGNLLVVAVVAVVARPPSSSHSHLRTLPRLTIVLPQCCCYSVDNCHDSYRSMCCCCWPSWNSWSVSMIVSVMSTEMSIVR